MSTTTRRTILIVLAILLALFLWAALGPSSDTVRAAGRAPAPPAPVTHTVVRHRHGMVLRITRTTGIEVCPEYPNGVLAGWLGFTHRSYGPWPEHFWRYTYGPWGGAFCSNNNRIWNMDWGGSPDGSANGFLFWTWYPADTTLADHDNQGDVRWRKWRSHFGVHITGFGRDEYPWLYVQIATGARMRFDDGCGC